MSEPVPPHTPQPPYPYGAPPTPRPAGPGRGLAVAAIIVAAAPILLGGLWPAITIQLYRAVYDAAIFGVVNAVFALFTLALAAVALILGIVAVRRDAGARLLGGIAIGLAVATIVGTVLQLLASVIGGRFF